MTRLQALRSELSVERERARRLEAQLRNLADHDPVTDLLNRRSVVHEIDHHLAGCARYGAEGAFLLVGLDGLAAITRFIDGWNDRCQPFVWTKTADQILSHSRSQTTSFTRH